MKRPKASTAVVSSELFDKCVVRKSGDGWYEIKCKLGLWGVTGPSRESVEDEARHYWIQYYQDGEYQKHLSNESSSPTAAVGNGGAQQEERGAEKRGGSSRAAHGSVTVVEMSGNETDEQCEDIAWQMMCNAHPVEAHAYDPDRFWKYFHARAPHVTREQMIATLKECEEPEDESPKI